MKKIFSCPALELFCCLPLWKTVLFVSSRAFSLSTPTFLLSTPVDNREATWKKATKCNKQAMDLIVIVFSYFPPLLAQICASSFIYLLLPLLLDLVTDFTPFAACSLL